MKRRDYPISTWVKDKFGLEPWAPASFSALQHRMNSLMEDFFSDWRTPFGQSWQSFSPKVNVSEDKEHVYVTTELPGLSEKEIDVTLSQEALTIRGEKKEERSGGDESMSTHFTECSYGSFVRTIPLQSRVNEDKVDASFKNGILSITLIKTNPDDGGAKRVAVRSG